MQSAVKTICVELQKLASMVGKAKNMSAIHLPPPIIKDYIEVYIFLFAWISVFVPRRFDYGICPDAVGLSVLWIANGGL